MSRIEIYSDNSVSVDGRSAGRILKSGSWAGVCYASRAGKKPGRPVFVAGADVHTHDGWMVEPGTVHELSNDASRWRAEVEAILGAPK